jgi:CHAT domain
VTNFRRRIGALLAGPQPPSRAASMRSDLSATAVQAAQTALAEEMERAQRTDKSTADLPTGASERLGASTVDVHAGLPHATAELLVRRAFLDGPGGDVVFELSGYCCCGENLDSVKSERHSRPPRLALATLITRERGGESPAQSLYRLRNWSLNKYELRDWLARILARHNDELRLIIWDDTGFDIPWELFWVTPDRTAGVRGGWLGVLATVTRWTTIRNVRGRIPYMSGRCEGDVVGYVADIKPINADKALFEGTSARLADTIRELLSELDQSGPDIALVYIACHGDFSEIGFKFKIDQVSLGEVESQSWLRIETSGGLVFVNACHSGRQTEDPEYHDGLIRGFAEVFLRSGATGFIGTAGAVLEQEARKVADHLLRQFRLHPDRPAAAALRDYRRALSVVELPPLDDSEAAKELLPFVTASMYLFFGGPDTTVALRGMGG